MSLFSGGKLKGTNNICKIRNICNIEFLAENMRPGYTCNNFNIYKVVVNF